MVHRQFLVTFAKKLAKNKPHKRYYWRQQWQILVFGDVRRNWKLRIPLEIQTLRSSCRKMPNKGKIFTNNRQQSPKLERCFIQNTVPWSLSLTWWRIWNKIKVARFLGQNVLSVREDMNMLMIVRTRTTFTSKKYPR